MTVVTFKTRQRKSSANQKYSVLIQSESHISSIQILFLPQLLIHVTSHMRHDDMICGTV